MAQATTQQINYSGEPPGISNEDINAPQQAMLGTAPEQAIQQFRGYSDTPGYYDQPNEFGADKYPDIEQRPIPAGLGQEEGVLSPAPITVSVSDIARMNPKEAGAAIEKQMGKPRPTFADTAPKLKEQATAIYNDTFIRQHKHEPDGQDWDAFDKKWEQDQSKVIAKVKLMAGEWDKKYQQLEKQANDIREQNKIVAGKRKDAREWIRDIVDQVPVDKKQNAMHEATKELARIMSNPDLSTIGNDLDNLRDDMRSRYGLQKVKGERSFKEKAIKAAQRDVNYISGELTLEELVPMYEAAFKEESQAQVQGGNNDEEIAKILTSNGFDPTPENIATFRKNNAL